MSLLHFMSLSLISRTYFSCLGASSIKKYSSCGCPTKFLMLSYSSLFFLNFIWKVHPRMHKSVLSNSQKNVHRLRGSVIRIRKWPCINLRVKLKNLQLLKIFFIIVSVRSGTWVVEWARLVAKIRAKVMMVKLNFLEWESFIIIE